MKKFSKSLIFVVIMVCSILLLIGQPFYTENNTNSTILQDVDTENTAVATSSSYDLEPYIITDFIVSMDCSKGRKAVVKETLRVHFNESSHGIFRVLNMSNNEDYSNIKVDSKFALLKNDNNITLQIGNPDYSVIGDMEYNISYNVVLPKYKESKDSFIYNIIPFRADAPTENFSVDMILPVEETKNIQLVTGSMGSETNNHANLTKEGKHLKITSTNGLQSNQGVSIRIDFNEGVLKNVVNLEPLYIFLVGFAVLLVAIVLLIVYGRDDKPVEVVRFDPPNDMPPCELGYLIDGNISNEDLTSLFFYWASQGALKIHEKGKNVLFEKVGELPATAKSYEIEMFHNLFKNKTIVDPNKLNDSFCRSCVSAKKSIENRYRGKLYENTGATISNVFMIIAVVYVVAISILADFFKYGILDLRISFLGIIIGFIIFGYYTLGVKVMKNAQKLHDKNKKIMYFALYGLLGVVIAVGAMFLLSFMQKFILIKSFAMIICPVLTCWIAPYINKRSKEYNLLLGEILGFKNFILVAEKDRLEALVKENPEYYYNILPFANVLGVSDVLEDKFKNIPLENPAWYVGNVDLFDIYIINRISRNMTYVVANQIASHIVSQASDKVGSNISKFGGGSSGSGFSGGGGFGGGGVGRW